ncbi:MAG: hypothetical protein AAFP23_00240 [Pseudomonadota bacterium]
MENYIVAFATKSTFARNKPKAPGERLPVPAGWRCGYRHAWAFAKMCVAAIKRAGDLVVRHPTGSRAPGLGRALSGSDLGWHMLTIDARRRPSQARGWANRHLAVALYVSRHVYRLACALHQHIADPAGGPAMAGA